MPPRISEGRLETLPSEESYRLSGIVRPPPYKAEEKSDQEGENSGSEIIMPPRISGSNLQV